MDWYRSTTRLLCCQPWRYPLENHRRPLQINPSQSQEHAGQKQIFDSLFLRSRLGSWDKRSQFRSILVRTADTTGCEGIQALGRAGPFLPEWLIWQLPHQEGVEGIPFAGPRESLIDLYNEIMTIIHWMIGLQEQLEKAHSLECSP